MRIVDIIWFPQVIDKLDWKHNLTPEEVEEALFGNPMYRKRGGISLGKTFTQRLVGLMLDVISSFFLFISLPAKPSF